jgi:hypothetical protein
MHVQIDHGLSPVEPVPETDSLTGQKVIVDLQDYVAIIKKILILEHIQSRGTPVNPGSLHQGGTKVCSVS